MKIYKLASAFAYLLVDEQIEKVPYNYTHLDYVEKKYELTDSIVNLFENSFGEKFDFNNDYDIEWKDEEIKDFMLNKKIFCVVVDDSEKQVYVRPNLGSIPDRRQMKELSDWAIENGYNERIIIDYVVANNKIKIYKLSDWQDKHTIYKDDIGYIKGYQGEDGRWHIMEFVINPEYRGKGYAKELAKHIPYKSKLYAYPMFNIERTQGKKILNIPELIEFYKKIGFESIENEPNVMIRG